MLTMLLLLSTATAADCFETLTTELATDKYEGRGVGTEGLDLAAHLIEGQLAELGLKPSKDAPFPVTTGIDLADEGNLLNWDTGSTEVTEGFMPMGFSASGAFSGDLVFVGYGIRAKALDYDDYAGHDVRGKVVLAMRYEPGERDENSPFDGKRASRYSDLRDKALRAREAGAAALILVTPPEEGDADALPGLRVSGPTSDAGLPVLQVTREVANTWLAAGGLDLATAQAEIDSDYKPRTAKVPLVVSGEVQLKPTRSEVRNVIAVLPGKGALKKEAVVVGAHYDHLGFGGRGSFRPDEHAIHNGADDNASGVAGVLCAVEELLDDDLPRNRRSLVVALFTAEEVGLGGSGHYVDDPVVPLDRTVAMINLDMVGQVRDDNLQVLGTDSAPEWKAWLEDAVTNTGLKLQMGGDGYGPSDHMSFYTRDIPVVHLFSGAHERYHTPEDDADTLNMQGGTQVATLLAELLEQVLVEPPPTFQASSSGPAMGGDSRGYGAYLGTIPDYSTMMDKTGGVLLSGVRAGGPADRAGIAAKDRIIGMAGVEIRNLYDMTFVLRDHRPGDTIEVVVDRDGTRHTLLATLGKRGKAPAGPHGAEEWSPKAGKAVPELLHAEEKHLTDLRQLTFGGENAEAYWSPDGKKLIYQRTGPDGGCDQQYVLDLDTGESTRVSSGKGRTTCGYYAWPDGDAYIYATTEGGDAACPPTPDRSMGYVWPLYADYELVWQKGDGQPEPYLPAPGYDAEATVCMQDGRVVFTSVRDGDLELYVAEADGTGLKRLTNTPGYDGGAFFTPDCSEIVWRASRPEGDELAAYQRLLKKGLVRPGQLEIYLMKADGTDVRQLTDNGAANFGPYPKNDGSAVIYSSNFGDSPREFDLWLVSRDGGEPERVTYTEQFDGFPMFSPDGKWLVFGSNRGGQAHGETNLFLARWAD